MGEGVDGNGMALEDLGLEERELELAKRLWDMVPEANVSQVVRFLRARNGDLEKARPFLEQHIEWRKNYFPLNKEKIAEDVQKCKCTRIGSLEDGTHVYLTQLNLFGKHTYTDFDASIQAMVALFEHAETMLGPLEKFVSVVSLFGLGMKNLDMKWIKAMGSLLQDQYPERLAKAYVAPVPFWARGLWNTIRLFMDPETRNKISMGSGRRYLVEHVGEEMLPVELGGTRVEPLNNDPVLELDDIYDK